MSDPLSTQALLFDRPATDVGATRVGPVPVPVPGAGQVSIDVDYAGINFKDVMARRGDARYAPHWPFVPGLEVAGRVRALGDGVTWPPVGTSVLALTNAGGLAEVALAEAALTVAIPPGVEPSAAAAVPGAATTAVLLMHRAARVRSGDVLLVHSAAGAVGRAVADLARLVDDVQLIGSVGSASRVDAAHRAGYDTVIVRSDALARDVRAATEGRGVSVVLDPQGTTFLEQDLAALAPNGRIVLFGNAAGDPLQPLPPTERLIGSNASVAGFSLAGLSQTAPEVVAAAMSTALAHLAAAELTTDVTVIEGLAGAPAAQQALADGTGTGKYVVRVRA